MLKRMKVKFRRQDSVTHKRVPSSWRKPRGIDNKLRLQRRGVGYVPKIGWRTERATRGKRGDAVAEVLVENMKQLEALKGTKAKARIAAGVGELKRAYMRRRAKELGITLVNG
ncbi:50S ribosomal protein L32e [Candidatus Micrarchaeota archaeon CG10_big_fil_rev_8_21_14_0_10_59_7]|nr:MAG: 50S ribosomal protein L32e [Candidatus Micrarchaeota archaeon CG10_big_fil_rev_8_21_14_0_10_59_7]